jgi:hypothetical protein
LEACFFFAYAIIVRDGLIRRRQLGDYTMNYPHQRLDLCVVVVRLVFWVRLFSVLYLLVVHDRQLWQHGLLLLYLCLGQNFF